MKPHISRRNFIKTSSALVWISFSINSSDFKKYTPLLSFSTLGCPDWSFETILDFAVKNDYKGIELRGIQRQLDLTKCPEFSSKENIHATHRLIKEKNLKIVDLGASAEMHHTDPAVRKKNLDEAKKFILLAQQLNCPYIRVFPNNFPKDKDKNETIDLIVNGLLELGDYAKDKNVTVLMETHGDLVKCSDIEKVMKSVNSPNVGLVWDIVNMWSVTKESPALVYASLKKYIRHTHIKDMKLVNGKEQYVLMGKGDTPIFEAIDLLTKNGYKGYYSFEWEKLWHPEIAEPEVALADFAKVMKQHFKV